MFGQRRTSSRIFNKLIYALEAGKNILRGLFRKKFGLSSLLENLISLEGIDIENKILSNDENYFIDEEYFKSLDNKKIIFESIETKKSKNYKKTILKGNPVVIVCQNIDYYMGGTENIWGSSEQIGIQACGLKRKERKIYESNIAKSFHNQSSDDKQIELITYTHGMDMGLDRVTGGRAKKVYQGHGPFIFTFKKILSRGQKKKLNNVYINIDGEFYRLVQPKQIIISINDQICNGQIKFLKNEIAIWRLKQKSTFQKIQKKMRNYKSIVISIIPVILLLQYNFKAALIFLLYMILLFL
jgi:diacylglycerol kinase (ATP)